MRGFCSALRTAAGLCPWSRHWPCPAPRSGQCHLLTFMVSIDGGLRPGKSLTGNRRGQIPALTQTVSLRTAAVTETKPAPHGRACPAKQASPAPHPWDNAPPASTRPGAAPMSMTLRPVDPSTASRTRQPVDSVVTEPCDDPDFSVTEPCDGPDEYLTVSYSRRVKILRRKRPPAPGKRRGLPAG